eukprot:750318-Hanusia_phi.AAC.5
MRGNVTYHGSLFSEMTHPVIPMGGGGWSDRNMGVIPGDSTGEEAEWCKRGGGVVGLGVVRRRYRLELSEYGVGGR